jgi:hypothetical protein
MVRRCGRSPAIARIGVTVVLSLIVLFVSACGSDDEVAAEEVQEPTPTPTLNERAEEIVRQLRSLMEIETAYHSAQTVIDVETEGGRLSRFFTGDRILLIAHGNVIAGVDLGSLDGNSVEVFSDSRIQVTLPDSQILISELDEQRTQIVDRDTGVFSGGDQELEAEAYEEAKRMIIQSACEHDILRRAADDADFRIRLLLQTMGFDDITVIASPDTCPR